MFVVVFFCCLLVSAHFLPHNLATSLFSQHTVLEVKLDGPAKTQSANAELRMFYTSQGQTEVLLMTMYNRVYYRQGNRFLVQNFPTKSVLAVVLKASPITHFL